MSDVLASVVSFLLAAADVVPLDMHSGWWRRDWQECHDPTRITFENGAISFTSHDAKAQLWQTPLRNGPVALDEEQSWLKTCATAPRSFASAQARQIASDTEAIHLSELRWLSWRWRVSDTLDDTGQTDAHGRITGHNDFAAKLGLVFADENSRWPQEMAYVWTRRTPRETILYQQENVIPIFLTFKLYRIVSESGRTNVGRWTTEVRDVAADYARIRPQGRAGVLLRVYLMTDTNSTHAHLDASYADITFHRERPDVP